jgi:hypothetical protein
MTTKNVKKVTAFYTIIWEMRVNVSDVKTFGTSKPAS